MTDQKHTKEPLEPWLEAYNFEQKQMAVITLDEWNALHSQLTAVTKQRDELREALESVAFWESIDHICEDESYCQDDRNNCCACKIEAALTKTKESVW